MCWGMLEGMQKEVYAWEGRVYMQGPKKVCSRGRGECMREEEVERV